MFTEVYKTKITYTFPLLGEFENVELVNQNVECDMCEDTCVLPRLPFIGPYLSFPRVQNCPYKSDFNVTARMKMPEIPEYYSKYVKAKSKVTLEMEYSLRQEYDVKQNLLVSVTLWKRNFDCGQS